MSAYCEKCESCEECGGTGHAEGCEQRDPARDLGDLIASYPCSGCCPRGCSPDASHEDRARAARRLKRVVRS